MKQTEGVAIKKLRGRIWSISGRSPVFLWDTLLYLLSAGMGCDRRRLRARAAATDMRTVAHDVGSKARTYFK